MDRVHFYYMYMYKFILIFLLIFPTTIFGWELMSSNNQGVYETYYSSYQNNPKQIFVNSIESTQDLSNFIINKNIQTTSFFLS